MHRGREMDNILKFKRQTRQDMLTYSQYLCSCLGCVFYEHCGYFFCWRIGEHDDTHLGNRYRDRSICILYLLAVCMIRVCGVKGRK